MRRPLFITSILALAVLSAFSLPADGSDAKELARRVRAWRAEREGAIVSELADLLSIPNVASDGENIRRNAIKIAAMMRARCIKTRLLSVEGSPPLVYGELFTPGAQRTIAVYAHYDGQPVVPEKWEGDPWTPVLRDAMVEEGGKLIPWEDAGERLEGSWRLFARSAGDDKAPIVAWLRAIDALRDLGIEPSVNVRFFFEGEEEAGSPHLEAIFDAHSERLQADVLLICDGPVHQSRRPQLYFGARGITGLELTVYGPTHPLHSGHYGNWAPNPAARLAILIAGMRDAEGRILIDGFYERVAPLSESERSALAAVPDADDQLRNFLGLAETEAGNARLVERIMLPAVNIRGLSSGQVGARAKNAIPTEAAASIGFRLVPDLTPTVVKELVEDHIRRQGYHIVYDEPDLETRLAHPRIARLQWEAGYPSARTPLDLPASRALIELIEAATDEPLVVVPTLGGSVPLYLFIEKFGAPVVGLPIANHDNNQHGPNENLRLQNLWDGIEVNAVILALLGDEWE